jgi:hypothetical protein
LIEDGKLIGAIGCSGGTSAEDETTSSARRENRPDCGPAASVTQSADFVREGENRRGGDLRARRDRSSSGV